MKLIFLLSLGITASVSLPTHKNDQQNLMNKNRFHNNPPLIRFGKPVNAKGMTFFITEDMVPQFFDHFEFNKQLQGGAEMEEFTEEIKPNRNRNSFPPNRAKLTGKNHHRMPSNVFFPIIFNASPNNRKQMKTKVQTQPEPSEDEDLENSKEGESTNLSNPYKTTLKPDGATNQSVDHGEEKGEEEEEDREEEEKEEHEKEEEEKEEEKEENEKEEENSEEEDYDFEEFWPFSSDFHRLQNDYGVLTMVLNRYPTDGTNSGPKMAIANSFTGSEKGISISQSIV